MNLSRRHFLLTAAGSALGAAAIATANPPMTNSTAVQDPAVGLQPITPAAQFFRQQIGAVPAVDVADWSLSVGGLVENPMTLDYSAFLQLPAVEMPCTVACIGNLPGGASIGHAVWSGIPLTELLHHAQTRSFARYANCFAVDGYTAALPIAELSDALLVYAMNGASLTPEHGFPARLLVPGRYGYKMPKWIKHIELSEAPVPNFWEGRGWSRDGIVQTTSAILSPQRNTEVFGIVTFAGIAYAGSRMVTRIELSIDGGDWMSVPFAEAAPHSRVRWSIDWTPPAPGVYEVKVRATDSTGFTQLDNASAKPFPNGTAAQHAVVFRMIE
jgi:DMSO/TMAO reductase YedYZ molybdopterin-dependent catalytic subunit